MKIVKTTVEFKPIVLSIVFIIVYNYSFSQSKKQQIISLNIYADSLKQVLLNQDNTISKYLIKIDELNKSITSLQRELNLSKLETSTKVEEVNQLMIKIRELDDSIRFLKQSNTNNFIFPYKYGQPIYIPNEGKYFSTVYLNFIKESHVVTDSIIVKFDENNIYHFYFFTPITEDLNIQCPKEFGYISFDNLGRELFKNFDPNTLYGNSFNRYLEFNLGSKTRRLIGLLSSGCGSGGSIQYYDLEIINEKLNQTKSINVSVGGYEFTHFLPQKKIYINGIRKNPESHWSGETRYTLDFYNLINDQKIGSKVTNNRYPHFADSGEDELLKLIEKEEPGIMSVMDQVVDQVVDFPDISPSFDGGENALISWLQDNLRYPEISMEMGEQGKVYLKFIVEKDGTITNLEIIKGVSKDLDNEAKRLIRSMPRWKPGESKGLKVRSSFTMPINFELN